MEGWRLVYALKALEPRYVPVPRGHLTIESPKRADPCVFVAGVRHCPRHD